MEIVKEHNNTQIRIVRFQTLQYILETKITYLN